jgi:hypothetical protein
MKMTNVHDEAARDGSPGTADRNGGGGQNGQKQHKPNGGATQSIADAAAGYFKRGRNPVPVSRRTKRTFEDEWQNLPYSPDRFLGVINVGIQFGPRSGNLVDVDLDSKLALEFADSFLPGTNAIFGRASKPRSHRLYIANFNGAGKAAIQYHEYVRGKKGAMMVELRIGADGRGAQSVVPPSIHESGETIQWMNDQPTPVDAGELRHAVVMLAVACLLKPRYPGEGSRHDGALVLGGALARAGWPADDIEHLAETIAIAAGDDDPANRAAAAKSAVEAMANGTHVPGLKRMAEVWGEDAAKAFAKWGIGSRRDERMQNARARGRVGMRKEITNKVEDAIINANCDLFLRGNLISRIDYTKMKTWDEQDVESQGIVECGNSFLKETIGSLCTFTRYDARSKQDVICDPPEWISHTLKERLALLRLPILNGVSNCPILRANGEMITTPGYHAETGLYYDPRGVQFPEIAREPDQDDAREALNRIKKLFHTFPFVGPKERNPNLSVALSLLLTTVARRALDFVPLHAFDSPVADTGKSMINDIVALVATGDRAAVIAHTENQEEFDKLFDAIQMTGTPLIPIDNCDGPLKGTKLNQAITQTIVKCRILGKSEIVPIRSLATICANGNNLVLEGDLTRRSACGRMDPGCERPELLRFSYSPIQDATENRVDLVVAALTVLRAYHVAGCPERERILGGFENWSVLVRGALIWLGEADPMETMDEVRKNDPKQLNLRTIMYQWAKHWDAGVPVTVADMVAKANEWEAGYGHWHPEWRDALLAVAAIGNNISNRRLGTWLGANKGG